ncbi:MAG: SDR family oxidoreductase [Akkermansiaceae bacterium]|nr:SDR family oxidoreductase [Akkermansiaceae bacterium]
MSLKPAFTRAFSGKNVILTGGASGIGQAMLKLLLEAGAKVHVLDASAEGLAALEGLSPGKGEFFTHLLDVRDRDAYAEVIREIRSRHDVIDFLFNNAGVTLLGEAYKIPFDRWKWLLDINLMGVIHGSHLVYPTMVAKGRGTIVNTASIAGSTGYATAAAYTTSKAAVLEFTRSLRAEAEGHGIRVIAACPGYVDSNIFARDRIMGAEREEMIKDLPVPMMTPDQAAYWLLEGVAAGKNTVIFPFNAKLLWTLSCWAPSLIKPFHRRFLRVFQKTA